MNHEYRSNELDVPDFMRQRSIERRTTRTSQNTSQASSRRRPTQDDYERLKRNSTTGGSARRTRDKKIEVPFKNFRGKLGKIVICMALGAGITIGGFNAVHNIQDQLIISQQAQEFSSEVIAGNKCRLSSTDENSNNWGYLHDQISKAIEEKGYDYDEALYLFLLNLDHNKDWNMDELIRYSEQYKNYADFLKQNGYESSEDFKETMKKKVILEAEADEKNRQLAEMNDELDVQKMQVSNSSDMSMGGK